MGTRDKLEIMVDILKVLKGSEVTKTAIVYNANLNFKRADQYLDMMMQINLVEKPSDKYNITETGNNYLKMMNEVNSIIVDKNLCIANTN
ncbi:winged helix-turn-helix domain-containing protein [Methanococcoides alaskense]|uniref:Transcriptional regulator n=1 Tax=Methanococcoides alaskense TaxID=325778 RepID=A0AA90ZAT3_9EURY|nr:winged helix-turn-helix domain-containing protein [Methanococcoides alaskense]MDA0525362.1 winged helix-turn-helix domain-containing protein [Methanococcoides alaskense]MDR6221707.1 putative transcriptional regulator [Methanococcoides alaskense]